MKVNFVEKVLPNLEVLKQSAHQAEKQTVGFFSITRVCRISILRSYANYINSVSHFSNRPLSDRRRRGGSGDQGDRRLQESRADLRDAYLVVQGVGRPDVGRIFPGAFYRAESIYTSLAGRGVPERTR